MIERFENSREAISTFPFRSKNILRVFFLFHACILVEVDDTRVVRSLLVVVIISSTIFSMVSAFAFHSTGQRPATQRTETHHTHLDLDRGTAPADGRRPP
jgi:hypothetical protein